MTPLPKKKHSKSDTKTRKAAISLRLPSLVTCPNCKELKFPHRACPSCGFYSTKSSAYSTKSSAYKKPAKATVKAT